MNHSHEKCLIIAEAGVNHNGKLELALRLCDAAKEAGADVIKFQTWKTENIITMDVPQAEYQKQNTGKEESQFEMLKKLELSYQDFTKIKDYCDTIGITFASTPDDTESLDFLVSLGMPFIKIGSGEIGNVSYLRYIGGKHLPVILSTGMSSISDIELSLRELKNGGATNITLLHCTTSYPCMFENVNLNAMLTIRDTFKLPIGYSDHTLGNIVSVAAVAMGAQIIEKHFTLDRNMDGPDHKASLDPREFQQLVQEIRNLEKALGNGIKCPTDEERKMSEVILKRIVAKKNIKKGQRICDADICVKRNNVGMMARDWDKVIGAIADKDYYVDEGIEIQKEAEGMV